MRDAEIAEMLAFVEIAEHCSFSRAAEKLGVSRPTLSQTIRRLEERLGVRLLNRTTRSVSLTEIGQRLLTRLRPMLADFRTMVDEVSALSGRPSGTLRLNMSPPAAALVLHPILGRFMAEHPAINLDVVVDASLTDIVSGGFDAGIRLGERIERGMTTLRLTGPLRASLVASPDYLRRRGRPLSPHDLHDHQCLRFRFRTSVMSRWAFQNGDRSVEAPVDGPLITDDMGILLRAALDGIGIADLPDHMVAQDVEAGRLVRLLDDWMRPASGFFLYYPSRGHVPGPLQALIDFMGVSPAREANFEGCGPDGL